MKSMTFVVGVVLCCAAVGCQNTDLNSGPTLVNDTPAAPVDPCPPPELMPLVINELMLVNDSTIMGPEGFQPWIELYNPTTEPYALDGLEISAGEVWEVPCGLEEVIEPGEYLVLFFSDAVPDPKNPDLIIDFLPEPLVGTNLTLLIDGELESFGIQIDTGTLGPDESVGLSPDGDPNGDFVILKNPTPGTMNSDAVPPPPTFVRGDVDADGDVDGDDLALLNQIVFEGTAPLPACVDRVDVNDDGAIDLGDPSFFVLALESGGPTIPAPFPAPGEDLTPDDLPCENEVGP